MTPQQTPDPRTPAGDPEPGEAASTTGAPADDAWGTVRGHEQRLLQGVPSLTLRQIAERAGTGLDLARRFWRAMGFADVDPDEVCFTDQDAMALRTVADLIDETDDGLPSAHAPGGGSPPAVSWSFCAPNLSPWTGWCCGNWRPWWRTSPSVCTWTTPPPGWWPWTISTR
ncbi:hypothetical protein [Actinomyces ruminis]|uniref:hypothetical protein n=1 Tax=Actinomyces ruminis TaxID=1937003 RepID=UPI003B849047